MPASFSRIGNSLGTAQKGGADGFSSKLNGTSAFDTESKINDATRTEGPKSLSNLNTVLLAASYTATQIQSMTLNDMVYAARASAIFSNTAF